MSLPEIKEVRKDIDSYLKDPVGQEFLGLLNKSRLEYPDFYRIKKYLDNPEHAGTTIFSRKELAYLINNLRFFHKLTRKRNACRVFLALRRSDNCHSLSQRLNINRATVRHWIDRMLESMLIIVTDFSEGVEILLSRNYSSEHCKTIIRFLDVIAESKLKQMFLEKSKKEIKEELSVVDTVDTL